VEAYHPRDTMPERKNLPAQMREVMQRIRVAVQERLTDAEDRAVFLRRLDTYGPDICELLYSLYGDREDFASCLQAIFLTAADAFHARPPELKALDLEREADQRWYQQHTMMGGVCYVDLFAGTLRNVRDRIPYFKELGLTYLHLMPLFRTPNGPNDGGYAVSSYREVEPALGTMDDLRELAAELRANGISLALDFVFNHTANNHDWALKARAGDATYQAFYFIFDDRTIPDAYERTLREIFPNEHSGAFTYYADIEKWVWTTFHTYQWDLNYRNPTVLQRMLGEMLFLANIGAEVLRLDAVPFIWKEMGTSCENLPQAHTIIQTFNALVRVAAPAVIFKSEAIVHPDNVVSYFGQGRWAGRECEISYNPVLMVSLWEALATQHTHLLTYTMQRRFEIPENCCWVNYVRSHDDIGWGFADEDAEALGIHGFYHRQFLNRFYTGQEERSFAVGYPFQFNQKTLDMRISGTTASLAGLEQALKENDSHKVSLAIQRILLIYGLVLSMGGIPLIYLGDEVGTLNDYRYQDDPGKADDSRWVHRPHTDWSKLARRDKAGTIEARIFGSLLRMIAIRKEQPAFGAAAQTDVLQTGNPHIYVFVKTLGDHHVLIAGNFTDQAQTLPAEELPLSMMGGVLHDLITDRATAIEPTVSLAPYALLWLSDPG
jgi:amylosucrase